LSDEMDTKQPGAEQSPPSSAPMSAGRRAALRAAGIVALLLLVFVALPAVIATQPGFMQRYPSLKVEYSTWAASANHKGVACQRCHVAPDAFAQTAYGLTMASQFYVSIVDPNAAPPAFQKPTIAACSSCHRTLITTTPKGDLKIPHRAHVDVLKIECATCHQYLVHQLSPEGGHTPTMAACLKCHNGQIAKNACATCHTNKATPASHSAPDWDIVHAQKQTPECAKCHGWTQHWCTDCHSRRPTSHGPDWRTVHGAAVKVHRNCEACHTGAFCITCHGDVPQLNFNPALKLVVQ
jgi:hypothetical protein